MTEATHQSRRILRRRRVEEKTGLCRSSIYDKLNAKSKRYDPTFPRPIPLGARAVGWLESDVEGWLAKQAGQGGAK